MREIDSKGHVRAHLVRDLVGKEFVHTLNGYQYKVVGVAWDGLRDEWVIVHTRSGSVQMFVRTVENFQGAHRTGRKRFQPVEQKLA